MTYDGSYAPGECQCGRTGIVPCCTFASYDDGSNDEPTCTECCTSQHGPGHPLDRDRIYSPD